MKITFLSTSYDAQSLDVEQLYKRVTASLKEELGNTSICDRVVHFSKEHNDADTHSDAFEQRPAIKHSTETKPDIDRIKKGALGLIVLFDRFSQLDMQSAAGLTSAYLSILQQDIDFHAHLITPHPDYVCEPLQFSRSNVHALRHCDRLNLPKKISAAAHDRAISHGDVRETNIRDRFGGPWLSLCIKSDWDTPSEPRAEDSSSSGLKAMSDAIRKDALLKRATDLVNTLVVDNVCREVGHPFSSPSRGILKVRREADNLLPCQEYTAVANGLSEVLWNSLTEEKRVSYFRLLLEDHEGSLASHKAKEDFGFMSCAWLQKLTFGFSQTDWKRLRWIEDVWKDYVSQDDSCLERGCESGGVGTGKWLVHISDWLNAIGDGSSR